MKEGNTLYWGKPAPVFVQLLLSAVLLLVACLTDAKSIEPGGKPFYPGNDSSRGASDTLRLATWNVNQLASTDTHRIAMIARKMQQQGADLYALQEIADSATLQQLLDHMQESGVRGFLAAYIPYEMRLAYLYRSDRIDSVSASAIPIDKEADYWMERRPFVFTFMLNPAAGSSTPLTVLNIHAKADLPNRYRSYRYRVQSADQLYRYIQQERPNDNLIVLGDFNDDFDRSIYQNQVSPYYLFTSDARHFRQLTKPYTENKVSTTLFHDQPIDHILVSDELFPSIRTETLRRISPLDFFEETGPPDTLSDHYMITTELHFNRSTAIQPRISGPAPSPILKTDHYPNPVQQEVTIRLELQDTRRITLQIYNSAGIRVGQLATRQQKNPGNHYYRWKPPSSLGNGIYFYRLSTDREPAITNPLLIFR